MTQVPPTTAYELAAQRDDQPDELCGAEQDDGSTCERPAAECPYHD